MHTPSLSRRDFVTRTATAAGLWAVAAARAATPPQPRPWTIGCLNRPWTKWSADEMLDGIKAAGYGVIGLQTPTNADPFNGPSATADYLAQLKEKIAARGLTAIQGRLRTVDSAKLDDAKADIRRQLAHAQTLGLRTLINTGTAKPQAYETWYQVMRFAAAAAADRGIALVTKPHGGIVGTAADLQKALERVNHPNFSIWYDAGNVIHYTGLDPLAELEPLLPHVSAFTAKDCPAKGGEVMIQFGRGKVDFPAIFRRLQRAGFQGPVMVESCAIGATAAGTTANARANREYLEKIIPRA